MDRTKQCWSCSKVTMFPKGNYFECIECGATWNKVPRLTAEETVVEQIGRHNRDTKYRPSRRKPRARVKSS